MYKITKNRPYFFILAAKCDLALRAPDLSLERVHCGMMVNISTKQFQNPSRNDKIMDKT